MSESDINPMDLSSPEPRDADQAWLFVIHDQQLCVSPERAPDAGLPRAPAFLLRQHPSYRFLGLLNGEPCYVCRQADHELSDGPLYPVQLRELMGEMDEALFTMAARALQVLSWLGNHRFCSRCGAPTEPHERELAMLCSACDYRQYPRITPCIIALVSDGEYALLGRSARFPSGFYSCLAGFMEAGETAEQAVRREVMEEVGVRVDELRYARSQSWPFPHSLMIGFQARYAGGDIHIDDDEIVDARWFHYNDLPRIPPPGSIARTLIDDWRGAFQPLHDGR
ncbi:NAD(+) diphosphatase [Alloalcanivorax mobilis]|uniref:NAD(+) diphosphatase n=1 Tax=Alloalcanivorax mobilis TaxID=2019569 RepID=UPI001E46265D|nr:NAD(+) diphosphatase [Alloalcanivorax mobilis]